MLRAAVDLADRDGLDGLTMRRLAQELDVEAMSLYHHVANKDEMLDGMVDHVFEEFEVPVDVGWRDAMAHRATSARRSLRHHPWAIGLLDSRTSPGPATLAHHDAVLGVLRSGGFPVRLAAHAFAAIDSFLYGFVLQEVALPFEGDDELAAMADDLRDDAFASHFPHLDEMMTEVALQPGYDFGDEFDFGLDLVLDGIERALAGQR